MTPYLIPGHVADGTPILSVLGKETFDLVPGEELTYADEEIPFRESDDDLESDLVAFKPMTDILLTGSVFSPRGKQALHMNVGITVNGVIYGVRVFGNRKAVVSGNSVRFSEPEPFESIPIELSRCYGGIDSTTRPQEPLSFQPNPQGTGFLVSGTDSVMELRLPNFENPNKVLTPESFLVKSFEKWREAPMPASLGPLPRDSWPRCSLAGMSPDQAADQEVERRKRIQAMPEIGAGPGTYPPAPPPILNPEYHQSAPRGLQFPILSGSEAITLHYFHPDHPSWQFQLPGGPPTAWLDTGRGADSMRMSLQTVEIRPDLGKIALTWRGSVYYGGPEAMRNFTRLDYGIDE
ncbi:MAG: DUF2169 domain-containing protein [Fibrobacterota bacterium]|nr:DUF2169 domain-containing protein [Fibrobacterota bacterium]QQS06392.1 MAG: DUF2169 domain-containing protein [Fibrobacterota bacterium]